MCWATQCGPRPGTYLSQASCVIVSGFRAALDLDSYPLSNLICLRCAERAKPKPVLIMHNYWLFSLLSRHISRTQSFQQNRHINFHALVAQAVGIAHVDCSAREVVDRQTHAHRGLIKRIQFECQSSRDNHY